jgi:uncharacterized protein (DUF1501 family)
MLSRRNFISMGSNHKTADKLTVNVNSKNTNNNADILITIFQRGAADGLNLVVPHGDDDYYINRPTVAIAKPGNGEGSAIDLDGFFGLHPDLAPFLPIFENQDLAMIHACGTTEGTHSHFKNQAFIERGTNDESFFTGWLARYVNSYQDEQSTAFKSVAMNTAIPKTLAGADQVVALSNIEGFTIVAPDSEKESIANQLQSIFPSETSLDKTAQATFSAVDIIAGVNTDDFPIENDAQYPDSSFGIKMRDLAILIKAGIGIETASVDIGGWDTHDSEAPALSALAQDFSQSLAAFYTDMGERMSDITLISITEFGRRATENGSGGTDHGTGNVAFVMGGGVNGGQVYTNWPGLGPSDLYGVGDLAPTTDYRTILAECLDKRLFFNDHTTTFPDFEVPEYLGLFVDKS